MTRRFFKCTYPIPEEIQRREMYYLVDWDLPRPRTQDEHRRKKMMYRHLAKMLGVRKVVERESSQSVLPLETREEAMKVAKFILGYGAKVNLREAKAIEIIEA